jgi:hypothetical protein
MDNPTATYDPESDPILRLIVVGEARTLEDAEELYLDRSMPEIIRLIGSGLPDEELANHPLMLLLRAHGSRGWEDSLT